MVNNSDPESRVPDHRWLPSDLLPVALTAITVVSGIIDGVSYLGLGHVFTANMTGNVIILGFAAAGAPGFSVAAALVSLAAFLIGAVGAGRLEIAMRPRPRHQWARTAFIGEALLLAVATIIAFAVPVGASYALIAVMAMAMGLRNGTVRKLAVPDITTTVLTGTLSSLASDSWLAGGANPRARRRISAVLAILVGALLGAWLVLHHGLGWPLLVSTIVVAASALGVRAERS
jgi:uncharacterized membrane protein YoaK (UPF0700 family)